MLALLPKIIVTIGSLLLLLGAFQPWLTVASYMIFRPLIQPFSWLQYKLFGFPIAIPFALIVILLGIAFPLIKNNWRITVEKSGFFIAFLAIAFLSGINSNYYGDSVPALAKLLTVWFLFNIAYNSVKTKEDAIRLIDALVIASVVPLAFGFYQAITGNYDMIYDAEVDRISSVFATGNDYGIFLTLVTAASAIRLGTTTNRKTQIIMAVILSLILVSQVLSLNRGTWLALTMGFIVAAFKYRRFINFKLVIMGGIIFLLIFSGKIMQRFQELEDPGAVHYHGTSTLEGRFAYWKALVPVIMKRPIRGHGIGSNVKVTEKFFGKTHKPHNDYVLIALEMGLFGVLAYIAFLLRIFAYYYLKRIDKDLWIWNFSMLMLTVYFIIISAAQNIVQSILNFPIFMVLVAITYRLNHISKIKPNPETDDSKDSSALQMQNQNIISHKKSTILRARVEKK